MKKKISRIISFVPAVLWAAVIYSFSDTPAVESTNESISVTGMLLDLISKFIAIDPSKREYLILVMEPHIRKIAHMTEFAVLFLLVMIPASIIIKKLSYRICFAALISFLYACSDEIHQLFVPGRAGRVSDVLIDMLGVTAAVILVLLISGVVLCIRRLTEKRTRETV